MSAWTGMASENRMTAKNRVRLIVVKLLRDEDILFMSDKDVNGCLAPNNLHFAYQNLQLLSTYQILVRIENESGQCNVSYWQRG
jgi:hypothetical protein